MSNNLACTYYVMVLYHIEQLEKIINSQEVKNYAYILHDRDYTKEDTTVLKKPHYHLLVQLYSVQRPSFFKRFSSDEFGTVFAEQSYSFKGSYAYLTHDTPRCIKEKKHLYDKSELTTTFNEEDLEKIDNDKNDKNSNLFKSLFKIALAQGTITHLLRKESSQLHAIVTLQRVVEQIRCDLGIRLDGRHCRFNTIDDAYLYLDGLENGLIPVGTFEDKYDAEQAFKGARTVLEFDQTTLAPISLEH